MSFVCTICHDLMVPMDVGDKMEIVVTKCGHMYHNTCLRGWFDSRDNPRLQCPYCSSQVVPAELRRVFPSGNQETDELNREYQDARTQRSVNELLQAELDERTSQLLDLQTRYEEEKLAHDILKLEHSTLADDIKKQIQPKFQEVMKNAQGSIEKLYEFGMTKAQQLNLLKRENRTLKKDLDEQIQLIENLRTQLAQAARIQTENSDRNCFNRVNNLLMGNRSNGNRYQLAVEDSNALARCIKLLQGLNENISKAQSAGQDNGQPVENDENGDVVIKEEPNEVETIDLVDDDEINIKEELEEEEEPVHGLNSSEGSGMLATGPTYADVNRSPTTATEDVQDDFQDVNGVDEAGGAEGNEVGGAEGDEAGGDNSPITKFYQRLCKLVNAGENSS